MHKHWPATGRLARFRSVVAPGAFGAVLLWACAMYVAFRQQCEGSLTIQRIGVLAERPRGVEVRGWRTPFHSGYGSGTALRGGTVEFVDERIRGTTTRHCRLGTEIRYGSNCKSFAGERPALLIEVKDPRQLHWWAPVLNILDYEVREAGTDRLLVRVSDIVFGGGPAGTFLRLLGGDQDFDRLSCRYASAGIGPWRPTLDGRPRVAQYERADLNLLEAAIP